MQRWKGGRNGQIEIKKLFKSFKLSLYTCTCTYVYHYVYTCTYIRTTLLIYTIPKECMLYYIYIRTCTCTYVYNINTVICLEMRDPDDPMNKSNRAMKGEEKSLSP